MFEFLLLFSAAVSAAPQDSCPNVRVSSQSTEHGKAVYWIEFSGGDPKVQPSFKWLISAGRIEGGQGSPSINVAAKPGEIVTATVDVGGYANCWVSNSSSEQINSSAPEPVAKPVVKPAAKPKPKPRTAPKKRN
ncbi:MAG: hypothetical protein EOP62_17515 [Sphingomonadales bacterium]|nr:MAG: hypothetical protein EOP62_17515 [Sphingomonadales bacterium]